MTNSLCEKPSRFLLLQPRPLTRCDPGVMYNSCDNCHNSALFPPLIAVVLYSAMAVSSAVAARLVNEAVADGVRNDSTSQPPPSAL